MFVYEPKIYGDYIVFMDGTGGQGTRLMVCEKNGETYSEPVAVAEDVVNFAVGDGFAAYTSNDAVFVYYFIDGVHGQLTDAGRALLTGANGENVIWYDITDLETGFDTVMVIQVP